MAAGREALEETGYAVDGRPVLHGFFLNRIAGGKRDQSRSTSGGTSVASSSSPRTSKSPSAAGSTSTRLPPDVGKGTARRVREIFDKTKPAAEW